MKINLWMEGYQVTGGGNGAQFLGTYDAKSLEDAVKQWAKSKASPLKVDYERLTFWGCRFFDNEQDARKSFG